MPHHIAAAFVFGRTVARGSTITSGNIFHRRIMIDGSCLCGGLRYEYTGKSGDVTACHCSDCRKAQGGSGVIAAVVDATRFHRKQGQALIREYESSPGKNRGFCSCCCGPLYSRRDEVPGCDRRRYEKLEPGRR
jgi:hypothetical protein